MQTKCVLTQIQLTYFVVS